MDGEALLGGGFVGQFVVFSAHVACRPNHGEHKMWIRGCLMVSVIIAHKHTPA